MLEHGQERASIISLLSFTHGVYNTADPTTALNKQLVTLLKLINNAKNNHLWKVSIHQ